MLILSTLFVSLLALFLYSIMQDTGINTKYARKAGNGMKESLFVDDEAEDEDEDDQDDEDSMASEDILPQKRSQFRKIIQDPELMSESSNQSDIFNKLDR